MIKYKISRQKKVNKKDKSRSEKNVKENMILVMSKKRQEAKAFQSEKRRG